MLINIDIMFVSRLQSQEAIILSQCKERFNLLNLSKDDNVTSSQMIQCCERLLNDAIYVESYLDGRSLKVTQYYSVLLDGEICIPWDWSSDVS